MRNVKKRFDTFNDLRYRYYMVNTDNMNVSSKLQNYDRTTAINEYVPSTKELDECIQAKHRDMLAEKSDLAFQRQMFGVHRRSHQR
jgi:hypothetical protein